MKTSRQHLRRLIREEIDPRLKSTHYDPRYQEGPPGGQEAYVASKETEAAEQERERKHDQKTLEFINPTQQHIQKYLDQAQKLNLKVVESTPRLLLVQGLEDDLVEFDAYFNEMEDPQVANSFYKTASKKDIRQNVALAMKPVTGIAERKLRRESKMKITKRQLRRIIKEEKAKLLSEGLDPRGLKTLLKNLGVRRNFDTVADILSTVYHEFEGNAADMKEEVEQEYVALLDDGVTVIDWPIEVYQDIWNLYKKALHSYRPLGR